MIRQIACSAFVWAAAVAFPAAQTVEVGDTLRSLSGPLCANGEGQFDLSSYNGDVNGGDYSVTWITFLASWCVPCREEAPITESIFQTYKDQGLKVLGVGFEWGYPYLCDEEPSWAETFGITYPIIDDDDSLEIVQMFALVYLPYHVFIDHNMVVRFILSGWDEEVVTDTIETLLAEMNTAGVEDYGIRNPEGLPHRPELRKIHPNPFNSSTTIVYDLPYETAVYLEVFDLSGRRVATLKPGSIHGRDTHRVRWRPNSQGSGIYIVRLETPQAVHTRKLLFVK